MLAEGLTALSLLISPQIGDVYGEVVIPRLHEREKIVEGSAPQQLDIAVGHLIQTRWPGQGGTITLPGHRVTPVGGRTHGPFRYINRLRRGDRIILRMRWGTFRYKVTRYQIVTPRAWPFFEDRAGPERLTLFACHPPGSAAYRYVVEAIRYG